MKKLGLKILELKLKYLAILFLKRYRPKIIAVTGSVGKSSTKEAIFTVLSAHFKTRRSMGSYNNEIGVPLTIMGEETAGRNILRWLFIFCRALIKLIKQKDYPEILILELGVDKPGDLDYLLGFIKPEISVITSIGAVHLEALKTEKEVFIEKSKLAKRMKKRGIAVLNFDDQRLRQLGLKLKRKVVFYGLDAQANLSASDIRYTEVGMNFNFNWEGSKIPARLNLFGSSAVYSALAASACAISMGLDLVNIVKDLDGIRPLKGRMNLLKGINHSILIDDTYNSNPMSAEANIKAASEMKKQLNSQRLVVVLGDMLELGKVSRRAHINIGRIAGRLADMIIAVGDEAKAIKEGALESNKNTRWFKDSGKASQKIKELIKKGDLVLIKGSQGVRMERISQVMLANKKDIKKLPRMTGVWKNR